MSDIGLIVPSMYEPPSRYNVTVTVTRDDGELPDPVTFAVAADQAAWRRSASIVSAHMADRIISIVTVYAPDRYAATAVAHAVVSDALRRQAAPAGAGDSRIETQPTSSG
jgi:hypothetical protein